MSNLISFTQLEFLLKDTLPEKRYLHSLSVASTCVELAKKFNIDETAARYVGLFHDAYRYIDENEALKICKENNIEIDDYEEKNPTLLHGAVAAIKFPVVVGEEPLSWFKAMRYHTFSHRDMGQLGAILFVSDYIEPRRKHLSDKDRKEIYNLPTLEEMVKNILLREIDYSNEVGRPFAPRSQDTLDYLENGGRFE